MSVNPIFPFGGAGISGNDAKVLDKLSYDEPTDTIIADSSLQVKPSTVYLGSAFGMSNAVQAVGFRLADGTDALCLVNRFDKDGGSYSNPKFFALGASSVLNVNLTDNVIMPSPVEVSYTTAGDNLTYSFEIKPAGEGRLRAQYWLGEDDSGAPVVDFYRDITQAEVDTNQPVLVEPNFYVLAKSSKLFVRFTGVPLKGNGTQPWFRSKVLPFKEVQFSGHYEYLNATSPNRQLYIGGTYLADVSQGNVMITVPSNFKDTFTIKDIGNDFIGTRYAEVNLSAFGQYNMRLVNPRDEVEFFRFKAGAESERWWYVNHRDGAMGRVPQGTGTQTTIPPAPEPQILRGMGVYPSSDRPIIRANYRGFVAELQVRTNLVVLNLYANDRIRFTGTNMTSGAPFKWDGTSAGLGIQTGVIIKGNSDVSHGRLLMSTIGATENHVTVTWDMHNNDSDEYAYFVKLE
ncbi:TPA: hypothetical protein PMB01_001630 [Vibrio cholerae]|nr:hypothetical protein [Vibrio cholerae]